MASDIAVAETGSRDLWGHPRGLAVLAGTELWERISFHGMLALLTLYMAEQLLLPGHIEKVIGFSTYRALLEGLTGPLSIEALAAQTFGLYIGLIYFTPVFGGYLGDRFLGRRGAVVTGATLMAFGHLCMAFDQTFLAALLLLILGAGFLRGNLVAQVGGLYGPNDSRAAGGVQIYYAMVNAGGVIAPLITGALGKAYGWHVGFGFAGFGMLAGLAIYLAGSNLVPADPPRHDRRARAKLSSDDWRAILALVGLMPVLTCFWVGQSQIWNVYNLWTRDHVDLVMFGWAMPVPWIQSMSSFTAVALVPVVMAIWARQRAAGREPDDIAKLALGCVIFAAFHVWDGLGTQIFGAARAIPFAWVVLSQFGQSFGYLYVQPVAIAYFTRVAPQSLRSMMVGIYFLTMFAGSLISGRLGAAYETLSPSNFWFLHAAVVAGGGVGLWLLRPFHERWRTA